MVTEIGMIWMRIKAIFMKIRAILMKIRAILIEIGAILTKIRAIFIEIGAIFVEIKAIFIEFPPKLKIESVYSDFGAVGSHYSLGDDSYVAGACSFDRGFGGFFCFRGCGTYAGPTN